MSQMLLVVDTATESCGVCLMAQGRVRAELRLDQGETHTRHVLNAVDAVISLGGAALPDIDAFAVTTGPGSFTGLRIGISTVKGLAFAAGKPVVDVSTLETLAHQADTGSELICAMLDARRREIYWRLYQRKNDALIPLGQEQVGPLDHLLTQVHGPCLFIGSGAVLYADKLKQTLKQSARWAPPWDHNIRPAVLGRLAWDRFQQGRFVDVGDFMPQYIRKSDAELNRKGLK